MKLVNNHEPKPKTYLFIEENENEGDENADPVYNLNNLYDKDLEILFSDVEEE